MFKEFEPEDIGILTGISLNDVPASERQRLVDEWAKTYCEHYCSLEEAKEKIPFRFKTPGTPIVSLVTGVYIIRDELNNSFNTLMIHFNHRGVNGITLTITPNTMQDKDMKIFSSDNCPLAIGLSDDNLYYLVCDGWDDRHSKEELMEIIMSLKY